MAMTFLTDQDEKRFVKTVNKTAPDENGNVTVAGGGGSDLSNGGTIHGDITLAGVLDIIPPDAGNGVRLEYCDITDYEGEPLPTLSFYGVNADDYVLLRNLADPRSDFDAATKGYVDKFFSEDAGVLLEETIAQPYTHPTFGQMYVIYKAPKLEVGKTYSVNHCGWNGDCVCQPAPAGLSDDPNAVAMGNFAAVGGPNTGEPFAMLISHAYQRIDVIDMSGSNPILVTIFGAASQKVDTDCLPNNMPGLFDVHVQTEDFQSGTCDHRFDAIYEAVTKGNTMARAIVHYRNNVYIAQCVGYTWSEVMFSVFIGAQGVRSVLVAVNYDDSVTISATMEEAT